MGVGGKSVKEEERVRTPPAGHASQGGGPRPRKKSRGGFVLLRRASQSGRRTDRRSLAQEGATRAGVGVSELSRDDSRGQRSKVFILSCVCLLLARSEDPRAGERPIVGWIRLA